MPLEMHMYVETRRDNAIAQSYVAFRHYRTIVTINYASRVALQVIMCDTKRREGSKGGNGIKVDTTLDILYKDELRVAS